MQEFNTPQVTYIHYTQKVMVERLHMTHSSDKTFFQSLHYPTNTKFSRLLSLNHQILRSFFNNQYRLEALSFVATAAQLHIVHKAWSMPDVGTLNLEVGVQQSLGYSFIDGADDQWIGSTIPYINYNFQGLSTNDAFLPFIGAFVGASYNDDDITGTMGPQLGFKSFVNDSTFIMVKYRYEWFFDELTINDIDDTSSDGNHVVTIGLGFTF